MSNDSKKTGKSNGRRKEYKAPALEKGLDILELLAGEEQGLNISELGKKLGRSVGEIFRMIAVLEQREYIKLRDASDAYVLTLKMFELSLQLPPIARLSAAAAPVMKLLAHDSNQSCHVAIYYDGGVHVVAQQDAPTERILSVRLGAKGSLMNTCSGHVLLAFSDDVEREQMISIIPGKQHKPTPKEIEKIVNRVRKQGHETIKSAQVRGVQDVGYPIFDHSGRAIAALVVPYIAYLDNSHTVSLAEASALVGSAAKRVSTLLGYLRAG